jgi:hypothetical protein
MNFCHTPVILPPIISILLIDDDRDRAQLIETALQSFQHRVMTIAGGIEAIDFLDRCGDRVRRPRVNALKFSIIKNTYKSDKNLICEGYKAYAHR